MEIIVSDDCSTDESRQVLRQYGAVEPRLQIHYQEQNLGMVANWNWCLQRARGRYVHFLFGDDRFSQSNAVSKKLRMLEANPDAVMAVSSRTLIDERSRKIGQWDDLRIEGVHRGEDLALQCLLQGRNLIGEPSAVLFRADAALRGFDSRFKQIVDLEFWLHLLSSGNLTYTATALADFRCHPKQATEANKQLRLGYSEQVMLLSGYLSRFSSGAQPLNEQQKRDLFSTLHYTRRSIGRVPGAEQLAATLGGKLSASEKVKYALSFRLQRPYVNLSKSVYRRLTGRPLEWSFGSGWRSEAKCR